MRKLDKKTLPYPPNEYMVMGRPAKDQGDFGQDVGLADLACVDQFGGRNASKFYHAAVTHHPVGGWGVYLEWGRITAHPSWQGVFAGADYQMVVCGDEAEARGFFNTQCMSKNLKRLEQVDGLWRGKAGKDGYLVIELQTRVTGLPDATRIMTPVQAPVKTATVASAPGCDVQASALAQALVRGVRAYTRAAVAATGVSPTLAAIEKIRADLLPRCWARLALVGGSVQAQVGDADLVAISKMVGAMVPRVLPRRGVKPEEAILNGDNIPALIQDLDAYEAALVGGGLQAEASAMDSVETLLGVKLSTLVGARETEIKEMLWAMTHNRHGGIPGRIKIRGVYEVAHPERDAAFMAEVARIGSLRKGVVKEVAGLQPRRTDINVSEREAYKGANVILGLHGTRSVNVAPILREHFRLPKNLPANVTVCGANFGHGIYHATDYKKSVGYTSYTNSTWASGSGAVEGRGAFIFMCDMIMGEAYRAPSTGNWTAAPKGSDSVFGKGGDRGHRLENDEHVVFDPRHSRIRYVIEIG